MSKRLLIVGGVAGGATAAARARRVDEHAEIIVFERGEFVSFANCGLPYYISGEIKERDSLLVSTPAFLKKRFNIDVRVFSEVTAIDRAAKEIEVKNVLTGDTYREKYDKLIISPGAEPIRPPLDGIGLDTIFTLRNIPDVDRIKAYVDEKQPKDAVIVGGGFIGLEVAENLVHRGAKVTVVEMLDQIMAPIDFEMAAIAQQHLRAKGVELILGDGVKSFVKKDGRTVVSTTGGRELVCDMVVLSIGVKPENKLAKDAGLALGERGGIKTDDHMRTSDPDIFAAGDAIEITDFVTGLPSMIPLAGPANKQGRIAADNIAGLDEAYHGTQGSAVAKIFDLTAAGTGANEKTLKKRGLQKGKDYESVTVVQNSHAGYYPGARPMTLKLLFSADGAKIYGAQAVGGSGVDKRIDTVAVAIRLGASVSDLKELELSYAPPYSSAKDPVNMAGFAADNIVKGLVRFSEWDAAEKTENLLLLDVREEAEVIAYAVPGSVNIPLGQLRDRLNELDRSKNIIILCAIGVRAYNAARILMQNGFKSVYVYPGGSRFYRSTHYSAENNGGAPKADNTKDYNTNTNKEQAPNKAIRLDCSGLQCPGPIMKVFEAMGTMKDGDMLEVSASDPGFIKDIDAWCRRTGNTLVSKCKRDLSYVALVHKGLEAASPPPAKTSGDAKTIIVFSGDLDRVLASFIIANGAAAMGRKVTMFFTFWGLTVLRRQKKQHIRKTFMESMFGFMLPRGSKKLKLSKMNMGGMGTAMMKKIMNDKNVDSLEALIQKALKNGVKIVACTMSMDIMGIRSEELIDGVELAGVGTYLGDAEESDVNLFI